MISVSNNTEIVFSVISIKSWLNAGANINGQDFTFLHSFCETSSSVSFKYGGMVITSRSKFTAYNFSSLIENKTIYVSYWFLQ